MVNRPTSAKLSLGGWGAYSEAEAIWWGQTRVYYVACSLGRVAVLIFQLRGFLQQQSAKLFQGCNDRLITTLELCLLHCFGAGLLRSCSPGAAKAGTAFLPAPEPFPPGMP